MNQDPNHFAVFLVQSPLLSMIKDFMKRPTPEQIMEHPFIVESSIRTPQEVDMQAWIRDVWDFEAKPSSPSAAAPEME